MKMKIMMAAAAFALLVGNVRAETEAELITEFQAVGNRLYNANAQLVVDYQQLLAGQHPDILSAINQKRQAISALRDYNVHYHALYGYGPNANTDGLESILQAQESNLNRLEATLRAKGCIQ